MNIVKLKQEQICNKILKIYDNTKRINFNELPNSFVIKTNHGSGFNIIVNNKSELDYKKTKKALNDWMKIDYGKLFAEFHYSFINFSIFFSFFAACYNLQKKKKSNILNMN